MGRGGLRNGVVMPNREISTTRDSWKPNVSRNRNKRTKRRPSVINHPVRVTDETTEEWTPLHARSNKSRKPRVAAIKEEAAAAGRGRRSSRTTSLETPIESVKKAKIGPGSKKHKGKSNSKSKARSKSRSKHKSKPKIVVAKSTESLNANKISSVGPRRRFRDNNPRVAPAASVADALAPDTAAFTDQARVTAGPVRLRDARQEKVKVGPAGRRSRRRRHNKRRHKSKIKPVIQEEETSHV